jgi:hypothetical protein
LFIPNGLPKRSAQRFQVLSRDAGQVAEALIDAVNLDAGGVILQSLHDPTADVIVQRIVGTEGVDPGLLDQFSLLKVREKFLYSSCLGLIIKRNNTPIVITQDADCLPPDIWAKNRLAAGIE